MAWCRRCCRCSYPQSLYFWESNTRSATVIGAVGAGGIGLKLLEAMGTNSDWDKVAYMVLLILFVVFLFDNMSTAIRQRLIGGTGYEGPFANQFQELCHPAKAGISV